ncbi:unnamed protein product [Cladocopium goreaui]|uniref:Uncharacterized protein n=1 Tax=Cladocopium goreaui TaxID=2562237 RepID=A0A9P1D2L4_9DINO|nr:unnamed protein product [Cladocopium goreaui]
MVVARKRVPVDMGSTAHPYAGQRQEQILKEIQAEAIALCRFYGKSPEEMTDTFKLFKSKNSPREAPEAVPKLGKLLPPVFHRPEQTFFPHAPTLVGASGLGQGPGNYCHQEIGGTAERRVFDDDVCSMPPSRGSQATVRSKQSNGFARAESAGDIRLSRGSSRSRLSSSSALLRQEIQKAVLREVSRLSTPEVSNPDAACPLSQRAIGHSGSL